MDIRKLALLVMAMSPLLAYAQVRDGVFIDGSIGRGQFGNTWGNDTAETIGVGYRWDWFSVGLGYVNFLGAYNAQYSDSPSPNTLLYFSGTKQHGVTADVGGRWNIGTNWYYSIKAGLYFWHESGFTEFSEPVPIGERFSDSGASWNAGLGIGYVFSEHLSVGLDYDWYHANGHTARPLSLIAEYRF